ncbi:MAG: sugar ABC transporter permease [Candidatus Kapaibacterium sp.]|nr:sugar ABC transporter permease [Ignavibacteriota bacterium]MCB9221795.1 sugar ABC transporter permease [Ignavibacteria bacterium]
MISYKNKDRINIFLLLLPWILTFLVFWAYPVVYSFILSLSEYKTLSNETVFIGLDNYIAMFNDEVFLKALSNTLLFVFVTVPITTSLATILAVMVDRTNGKLKEFFKAAYFLPSVTSLVVIALIFKNLYSKEGYINTLLQMVGMSGQSEGWLQSLDTALPAIMAMDIWIATGYYMIIVLAGLQTIPKDLYEAADISGATAWQQLKSITLPMLKPTLLFILVVNTIKSFQVFIEIYVMTKGGPLNETTTLVYQVYQNAFEMADKMGYASAVAYVLFFIILVISLMQMKLLKEKY